MKEMNVPLWAKVGAFLLVPVLTAGIAWGVGQARLHALEVRVERVEVDVRENTRSRIETSATLKAISETLVELRRDVKQLIRGTDAR